MKHFSERVKLRLLYTLAVNKQPLILQMSPGTEGWPFPRHQGSCGKLMVWAYQLLQITQDLGHNSLGFLLYYTRVFITDASSIGVIDMEQGEWNEWLPALTLPEDGEIDDDDDDDDDDDKGLHFPKVLKAILHVGGGLKPKNVKLIHPLQGRSRIFVYDIKTFL
uniref:Uncharacterized protein n=1 Tax=Hucho hucho TaxID=62062 RepID=A0A4W5RNN5_9TELE